MSSAALKSSKPPRPFESLASLKAAKKTYCSIDYQIECLNELYNQLMPTQNGGNRRASSSSRAQDGQRDSKALQQLKRELKANLRSNYGSPREFPPLERLKVVVMFDDRKKAFFDIRLRPSSGYPVGYPFLIDDSEGTICGLSEAIYQEVLKAVQEEEEEEERDRDDEGHNNNNNHNNSHAAEEGLDPVNIKQEVVDDQEEEEELITLDDDSDEEPLNNELQQEESYNSQVVNPPPAAAEDNAVPESEDFIVSAISAAAAASSSSVPAIVPPENGSPAVNPQATDTTTSNRNNTAEQQQQRQRQSVSLGQSDAVPINLEPAGSSTVTSTRVGRLAPIRAPRTGHNEAPAAATSVAAPPAAAAAANFRVLQVTSQTTITEVFTSISIPQQQQQLPPPSHHPNNNNNGTAPSAQQRQQQPPAAAVTVACGTLTMRPTENSSIFHIVGSKRPADRADSTSAGPSHSHSHSQPAQDNPKRAKNSAVSSPLVSTAATASTTSTRSTTSTSSTTSTPSTTSAPSTTPSTSTPFAASTSQQQHHQQHRQRPSTSTAIALAAVTAATASTTSTRSTTSTSSTTSAPSTTPSTSTPFAASTSQQQHHHQQHRPSSSTSTAIALATVTAANVEDYLRAYCPSYFLVKDVHTKVQCPDCTKSMTKYLLKDHLLWVHYGLKPYHCQWPGCGFTTGWRSSAAHHAKGVHNGNYAQYIEYREE